MNLVDYCTEHGVVVEYLPYKTQGLRGMAILGDDNGNDDIIILNQHRSEQEQNFDCGHEMVHLVLHREVGLHSFNCFDDITMHQDPYLEWHANEGSAELNVPYKVFLPMIGDRLEETSDWHAIEEFKQDAAEEFDVPEAVIKYRLENLKYEIHQYLHGTPINKIELLSKKQQEKRGIFVSSFNDLADEDFLDKIELWHNRKKSV